MAACDELLISGHSDKAAQGIIMDSKKSKSSLQFLESNEFKYKATIYEDKC